MKKLMPVCSLHFYYSSGNGSKQRKKKAYYRKEIARLDKQEAMLNKQKLENKKALRKLLGSEVSQRSKDQFAADFGQTTDVQWELPQEWMKVHLQKMACNYCLLQHRQQALGDYLCQIICRFANESTNEINDNYKSYTVGRRDYV
ncbi:MAG: hypothetical protein IPH28_25700 [Cytophagaceae bacterium]|nr:hypothetical protein [Cytophagaceae bacterium]